MFMKYSHIAYTLGLALLAVSCGPKKPSGKPYITGTITGGGGKTVYFEKLLPTGTQLIDSAKVDEKGNFTLMKHAKEKTFYKIRLGQAVMTGNYSVPTNEVVIISDSTETIVFNSEAANFNGAYAIQGSVETDMLRQIGQISMQSQTRLDSINQVYAANPQAFDRASADASVKDILEAQDGFLLNFIRDNEGKFVTQQALALLNPDRDFEAYKKATDALVVNFPDNAFIQNLNGMVQGMLKVAVGTVAPDFTVKTPDDQPISLADFKGKYVLVDFWASWCGPCRQENPNVVKAYNKYKGKNFEIFGVSLDQNKEAWVDAIKKDGLPWKHGSDLGYWNSAPAKLYNVQSIPYNFLIDPSGRIMAKNLRGEDLEKKLEEVLKAS